MRFLLFISILGLSVYAPAQEKKPKALDSIVKELPGRSRKDHELFRKGEIVLGARFY